MNETICWLQAGLVKPDDAQSVLVAVPDSEDETVWVGWYDSEADAWRCATSANVLRKTVTHWAALPGGPQ